MFTKYVTSISGPVTEVALPPGGHTDWEVELVAVIGARAEKVTEADAWSHIAGLAVGQDISERVVQLAGPAPQFSLGKPYPGFAPIGPWLVTPDEFDHPDDLELRCAINGEEVQKGRTRDLIFSVPALIAGLSAVLPLLPGDVIFTGTPAGVGLGRDPQRFGRTPASRRARHTRLVHPRRCGYPTRRRWDPLASPHRRQRRRCLAGQGDPHLRRARLRPRRGHHLRLRPGTSGPGDRHGNLVFDKSARNFNPLAAMAGRVTIAEVEELIEPGTLNPDEIHLPGVFVQRVVALTPRQADDKQIERRTVSAPPARETVAR